MKLGIGSYAYAWAIGGITGQRPAKPMDAMTFLRRAAALDVHLVQIADNLPLHTLSDPALDALLKEAGRLGVAIEVGTRGIQHDTLCTYLRIAGRAGSRILRTVIDTADDHPPLAEVVERLRAVMPPFERAGVTLALENHDRFKARELVEILRRVDSANLGVCLDTVNSFGALEGPEVVVETLGPYVVNLHLKDFSIRRADFAMGFVVEGTPAGQGRLNVPRLLDRLRGLSREDFNVILELWPAPEADIEATVRKEDAWAVASVAYLRALIPE